MEVVSIIRDFLIDDGSREMMKKLSMHVVNIIFFLKLCFVIKD